MFLRRRRLMVAPVGWRARRARRRGLVVGAAAGALGHKVLSDRSPVQPAGSQMPPPPPPAQ
ncbi:MAG: hypothetical protein AB7L13_03975 [Acidimicrobiia bacterium]